MTTSASAAPLVVVIGADLWRGRFASDPEHRRTPDPARARHLHGRRRDAGRLPLSGQPWRLGPAAAEPLADTSADRSANSRCSAACAPGATLDSGAGGARRRSDSRPPRRFHERTARLRPTVLPYTYPFFNIDDPATAVAGAADSVLDGAAAGRRLRERRDPRLRAHGDAPGRDRRPHRARRQPRGGSSGSCSSKRWCCRARRSVAGVALAAFGAQRRSTRAMKAAYGALPFWWQFSVSPGTRGLRRRARRWSPRPSSAWSRR